MPPEGTSLPSYYSSIDYSKKRPSSTLAQTCSNLRRFLKSPAMKRLFLALFFLPIPILAFFLGQASSLPKRTTINLDKFDKKLSSAAGSSRNQSPNSPFKNWAIALKTGRDVALKRTPIQLMTFLAPVRDQVCMVFEMPLLI